MVFSSLKSLYGSGLVVKKFIPSGFYKSYIAEKKTIENIKNYVPTLNEYIRIIEIGQEFSFEDILSDPNLSTQKLMSGIISYNNMVTASALYKLMKNTEKKESLIQRFRILILMINQL